MTDVLRSDDREIVSQKSVGLRPSHYEALRRMAFLEGHTSRSRVVQRLVEEEAARVLGDDWLDQVTAPDRELQAVAS